MRTITKEELQEIIKLHKLYFIGNPTGVRAYLSNADLRYADLRYANLSNAYLSNADLRYADLRYVKNISNYVESTTSILPEGTIIGYKKACIKNSNKRCIVKIKIPDYATRSNATGRKCRCNECMVLDITGIDCNIQDRDIIVSSHDHDFIYKIGETLKIDDFDLNRWDECSTGIHFFITKKEALDY
jgi:hypothetical protein